MDDLDKLGDLEAIHSALRGDVELITRYGEEHQQAWTGVWFGNEPAVRIVAAFIRCWRSRPPRADSPCHEAQRESI